MFTWVQRASRGNLCMKYLSSAIKYKYIFWFQSLFSGGLMERQKKSREASFVLHCSPGCFPLLLLLLEQGIRWRDTLQLIYLNSAQMNGNLNGINFEGEKKLIEASLEMNAVLNKIGLACSSPWVVTNPVLAWWFIQTQVVSYSKWYWEHQAGIQQGDLTLGSIWSKQRS